MLIIGIALGVLLVILGAVNISQQLGFESGLPSQVASAAVKLPELFLWILFIVGGVFLFVDVSRRTRLFNGIISFVVGAAAIFLGIFPLMVKFGIVNWQLIIPRWMLPWFSLVLGLLLVYDNWKVD